MYVSLALVFFNNILFSMKYLFLFIVPLFLLSCEERATPKTAAQAHKVKSIDFEEFKLIDISPKAQTDLYQWKSFQSLLQVMLAMAPSKIKNPPLLPLSNPDSLLLYSRLYPINSQTVLTNIYVERDWRAPAESAKDTVFRIEKNKEASTANLQWERFLVAGIPYTWSFISKKVGYDRFHLSFLEGTQEVYTAFFSLDPLVSSGKNVKTTSLSDDWKQYKVVFTPKKSSLYTLRLSFDEEAKMNDNAIFYRSVLELPAKDFPKVGQYASKIAAENTQVESSYYSVFFWLVQIEEALKELLNDDTFPERIQVPAVKARFRLFETQIKVLADNVRNNPDFKEETLKAQIKQLGGTFNSILARINNLYDSNLDERMQYIEVSEEGE